MLCPICKKTVDESEKEKKESPYPFCSPRCKLIDLGRWLGGKYKLTLSPDDDDFSPPIPPKENEKE